MSQGLQNTALTQVKITFANLFMEVLSLCRGISSSIFLLVTAVPSGGHCGSLSGPSRLLDDLPSPNKFHYCLLPFPNPIIPLHSLPFPHTSFIALPSSHINKDRQQQYGQYCQAFSHNCTKASRS